ELHGLIAELDSNFLGMLAHGRSQAAPPRCRGHHVPAIADMIAGARLIGLDVIGAQNLPVFFADEGLSRVIHPQRKRLLPSGITRICIGIASRSDLVENRPDAIEVILRGFSDIHNAELLLRTDKACFFTTYRRPGP